MRTTRALALTVPALALALAGASSASVGNGLQWHGYLDARVATACPTLPGWRDGGLGKLGAGAGDCGLFASGGLAGHWQLSPAWSAAADLQVHPGVHPSLGLLDAYLRYRPVSTTPWRWSLKAGAFFPPVSLENDAVAWTSPWTLTPSAINTWIGEEFRTIGVEARVERRAASGTLEAGFAAFRGNDPAGELLAARGWALHDGASPLDATLREPDVYAPVVDSAPPVRFRPFVENDGRPGWQADLAWRAPNGGRVQLLRYDNHADPATYSVQQGHEVFSWHTRFWSAGADWPIGGWNLLGQWMQGDTTVNPFPGLLLDSHFQAAYLLAGRNHGAWRPSLRVDRFRIRQLPEGLPAPLSEDGRAWTAALNWRPKDNIRITAEWLRIDSRRPQRMLEGLPPSQVDRQFQISLRLLF